MAVLLENGSELEERCTEFGATPLFWAVQGFSRYGPKRKGGRVSEVLNGKRQLSLAMIKRLHAGLRIPYESLLSDTPA